MPVFEVFCQHCAFDSLANALAELEIRLLSLGSARIRLVLAVFARHRGHVETGNRRHDVQEEERGYDHENNDQNPRVVGLGSDLLENFGAPGIICENLGCQRKMWRYGEKVEEREVVGSEILREEISVLLRRPK